LFVASVGKQGKGELALDAHLATYAQHGGADVDVAHVVGQRGFHLYGVARLDAVLETYFVDPRLERQFADEVVFHQQGTRLGHDFAKDDTWHNGFAREMALQEEFLACHMVFGMGHMVLIEGHLVNQEHRLAVGEILFDFVSVHVVVFQISNFRFQISNFKFQISNFKFQI
jgi:hypothetical protein